MEHALSQNGNGAETVIFYLELKGHINIYICFCRLWAKYIFN